MCCVAQRATRRCAAQRARRRQGRPGTHAGGLRVRYTRGTRGRAAPTVQLTRCGALRCAVRAMRPPHGRSPAGTQRHAGPGSGTRLAVAQRGGGGRVELDTVFSFGRQRRRLVLLDDAIVEQPLGDVQLKVQELHGSGTARQLCYVYRRKIAQNCGAACLRYSRSPVPSPSRAMLQSMEAARRCSPCAAAAPARRLGSAATMRRTAGPRRAAPPLRCAAGEPSASSAWSPPPPPEAAAHSCPYAELGAPRQRRTFWRWAFAFGAAARAPALLKRAQRNG